MRFIRLGRGSIQVGLRVVVRGEAEEGFLKVGASELYKRPKEEVLTRYRGAYRDAS